MNRVVIFLMIAFFSWSCKSNNSKPHENSPPDLLSTETYDTVVLREDFLDTSPKMLLNAELFINLFDVNEEVSATAGSAIEEFVECLSSLAIVIEKSYFF